MVASSTELTQALAGARSSGKTTAEDCRSDDDEHTDLERIHALESMWSYRLPPPVVEVDAGGVVLVVGLVLLPVLVLVLLAPLVSDDPPVVDVSLEPELDVPPPVAAVPPLELVFELGLELPPVGVLELELVPAPELLDVDLFAPPLAVVCVVGLAALVVGTTSGGAPVVSLLPLPLPPHAASAIAASAAAAPAPRAR